MKSRILRTLFIAFSALAAISCQTKVETTITEEVDQEQIKSEIEALEETYAKALNARDVEALLPYYAENAETYENGQEPMIGKKVIRERLTKQMTMMDKGVKISFKTKDILVSSDGKQVVETGGYTLSDSTDAKLMSGSFLAVFEKQDGKYQCVREMIVADAKKYGN